MKKLIILLAVLVGLNSCTTSVSEPENLVAVDTAVTVAPDTTVGIDSAEAANLLRLVGQDTLAK